MISLHFKQLQSISFFSLLILVACSNSSNNRAVTLDELEAIQAEDQKEWEKYAAKRDMLTAVELIELADCDNLPCVELYMRNLSNDFFYASKGEYAAQNRSEIIDTAGNQLNMPASTFYIDANPQASWRAAHTVHSKVLSDTLYNEFIRLGFKFVNEGYFRGIRSKQHRYVSEKYPNKTLYIAATYNPWDFKGLYKGNVTWPCYVFEVY